MKYMILPMMAIVTISILVIHQLAAQSENLQQYSITKASTNRNSISRSFDNATRKMQEEMLVMLMHQTLHKLMS